MSDEHCKHGHDEADLEKVQAIKLKVLMDASAAWSNALNETIKGTEAEGFCTLHEVETLATALGTVVKTYAHYKLKPETPDHVKAKVTSAFASFLIDAVIGAMSQLLEHDDDDEDMPSERVH